MRLRLFWFFFRFSFTWHVAYNINHKASDKNPTCSDEGKMNKLDFVNFLNPCHSTWCQEWEIVLLKTMSFLRKKKYKVQNKTNKYTKEKLKR